MKKTAKRINSIIAIILTLMMAVSMIPVNAYADEEPSSEVQQETVVEQEPTVEEITEPTETSTEEVIEEPETESKEINPKGYDYWFYAFSFKMKLVSGSKIGDTATFNVTITNKRDYPVTVTWMNSWHYIDDQYLIGFFGEMYSGGNVITKNGTVINSNGIKFKANESKTYQLKGTIPETWKNGRSSITVVCGDKAEEEWGGEDFYYNFNSTATSTSFRKFKNKVAYTSQVALWDINEMGGVIRNYMNESLSPAIPGLANTYTGKNVTTYVPQGLCKYKYNGNTYYLISAYDSTGKHNSVIYVLDKNWKFKKNLTMPNKYHNGGIAYDEAGNTVWFTGATGKNVSQYSVWAMSGSELGKLVVASGKKGSISSNKLTKRIINNPSSCIDYYKGRLWVGTWGESSGKIIGYKTSKYSLDKDNTISISGVDKLLNGFTFGSNNDIYLSYSHGRNIFGTSIVAHKGYSSTMQAGKALKLDKFYNEVEVPRMNEELLFSGNNLYVLYESAATEYISSAYVITDRITAINKSVWSGSGLKSKKSGYTASETIQTGESKEIGFEYDADNEVSTKEKILSFTPDTTGTYSINVTLQDNDQNFYVLGGAIDTEAEDLLIGEFSTVNNLYNEEGIEAEYSNTVSAEMNFTAGHEYNLSFYASAADETVPYSGTYTVTVSRTGDIDTTSVSEGAQAEETVTVGNSSCFEVSPAETGTYLIDWQSEGELAGSMITDSSGKQITLNDNYCELEAGETYYFSSTLLEGGTATDTAGVHFAYEKLKESQLQPEEAVSISSDTVMTYHAATEGRHVVKCSNGTDQMSISAYDMEGNLIGVGNKSMVFIAEADADYKITCTGVDAAAELTIDPYIPDISSVDVKLTKELKYKKTLKAPVPKLTEDQITLVRNTDYKVKYDGVYAKGTPPAKARNVGKHKVTITGIGKYKGSVNYYYTIKPASTSVSKLKSYKKAMKVYWKKQSLKMASTRISGYQVQVATNKSFTKNKKSKLVKGYSKTSYKFTKLKAKKTYYARVRTYKIVNGTKYYSSWSTVKKLKTK